MILHNLTVTGKKLKELTDCDVLERNSLDLDSLDSLDNEKVVEIALLLTNKCSAIHVFFDGVGFFGYQRKIALLYKSDWCDVDGEFKDEDFVSKESKKIYDDLKYKLKTL